MKSPTRYRERWPWVMQWRRYVTFEQNPLRRNTMEDVHRVVPVFDGDPGMSFMGIYDGHGGEAT